MTGMVTYVLEEHFQNTTGLLIDKTRDTLHTSTTSKTPDSGLGDTWSCMNSKYEDQ